MPSMDVREHLYQKSLSHLGMLQTCGIQTEMVNKGECSSPCDKDKPEWSFEEKKGKQVSQKPITTEAIKSAVDDTNNKLISAINNFQNVISKQTARMAEHEKIFEEQNNHFKESE